MNTGKVKTNTWKRKLQILPLLFVMIFSLSVPAPAKAADAVIVVSTPVLAPAITTAANTALSAQSDISLQLKELTLDGIAWSIVKKLMQQMTGSIVTWINSGFQGSPAFVTNLDKFLLNAADEVAGEFIYGTELGFLCEPIEFQVRAALEIQYIQAGRDTYEPKCTLSGIVDNIDDFLSGNFRSGGWPAFFELTVGSNNDPNKAFFSAAAQLDARIKNKQGEEVKLLDFGGGLFSIKMCDTTNDSSGQPRKDCTITTPGAVVERALTFEVGEKGSLALIEADEFNEIISALLGQLANQALSGANGLLGLGGNSRYSNNSFGSSGTQSYLDALAADDITSQQQIGYNPVTEALENEEEYADIQQEILDQIADLEDQLDEGEDEYPNCWDLDLNNSLTKIKKDAEENLALAEEVIDTLNTINDILLSTVDAQTRSDVLEIFSELEQEGVLITAAENAELRQVFLDSDLPEIIAPFQDHIDNEFKRCAF